MTAYLLKYRLYDINQSAVFFTLSQYYNFSAVMEENFKEFYEFKQLEEFYM